MLARNAVKQRSSPNIKIGPLEMLSPDKRMRFSRSRSAMLPLVWPGMRTTSKLLPPTSITSPSHSGLTCASGFAFLK
jgi:hypothetical protein